MKEQSFSDLLKELSKGEKKYTDSVVKKYEKLINRLFLIIDTYHSEDRDADRVIDDIFDELKKSL